MVHEMLRYTFFILDSAGNQFADKPPIVGQVAAARDFMFMAEGLLLGVPDEGARVEGWLAVNMPDSLDDFGGDSLPDGWKCKVYHTDGYVSAWTDAGHDEAVHVIYG
jgi:hypothetical protein